MSIRHAVKTVAATGAATLCAATFALAFGSGVAGADLSNGPTTLSTNGTVTAGTPYSSGQVINVVVGPNSTMNNAALTTAGVNPAGNFYVEMCTDTNGVLPSTPSNCEAATVVPAPHSSDGSMSVSGSTTGYTVYDLPDGNLGAATMVGQCDAAPNTCVVGIFSQNPGSAGAAAFTSPHLFSAAFQMKVDPTGTDSGSNPGDGTPEVPLAIGLPLAAVGVFGAITLRNRRRQQRAA
jgi:hypothetical protein